MTVTPTPASEISPAGLDTLPAGACFEQPLPGGPTGLFVVCGPSDSEPARADGLVRIVNLTTGQLHAVNPDMQVRPRPGARLHAG